MSERSRFNHLYKSAAWRALRPIIFERDDWLCQISGPTCLKYATEVDHITPLSQGGDWLDEGNLRAACQPCNGTHRGPPVGLGKPSREW